MAEDSFYISSVLPANTYYRLNFWINPLSTLKHAISALSDPTFNPSGMATLQAGEKGVEITINGTDGTLGFLQLTSSSFLLRAFLCREDLTQTISLTEILRFLNEAGDTKPVNVFAFRENPKLMFAFPFRVLGHGPAELFEVSMTDVDPYEFRRFPTVSCEIEAVIPTKDFIPMLDEILASERKPAFGPSKENFLDPPLGLTLQVESHSVKTDPTDRHVCFQWANWNALKTTINLVDKCGIWLVSQPNQHILFRFDLGEIGNLVFLKKADLMYGKDHIRYLGKLCSFFSNETS